MKVVDESQPLEVPSPTADLLEPKHNMQIGSWNVRTLNQTGKLAQTIKEMHRYKLDILGIQEARWTGQGRRKLTTQHTEDTIIWSGKEDHHEGGVALIITKEASRALLKWTPINERLLYARFNSRFTKLSIIVCYAPTEAAEEELKDFYNSLQATVETIPKHDMLLILGDFNAKVGEGNEDRRRIMGREGIGEINENGERL